MKLRLAPLCLFALCLTLLVVPATAQTVYSNGPINGNTDAWTINFGFIVSDTFNVTNNDTTITGGSFGMWLVPGDTLTSAELSITSGENGGTSYFDQTVNFVQSNCMVNGFGDNVCTENTTFNGPTLNAGTYWLNLQNATTFSGDPVYWDENSGPSKASENTVGSIPSEAFTVFGCVGGQCETTTTSTTSTTTSVPEPSSIMLFGSGILGLAGLLRRKLF
jgi:hypothetical protein